MTYTPYYPPAHNSTYVKATSYNISGNKAEKATDPALALTGGVNNVSWVSANGAGTNQKHNVDLGSPQIVRRMYIENGHNSGGLTQYGIKDFTLYGTNSAAAFANTDYADLTDLAELGTYQAAQHATVDASDPQYLLVDNDTAYQYYVRRIHNTWGGAQMWLRHIELQTEDGYVPGGGTTAYQSGLLMPWYDNIVLRNGLEMPWNYDYTAYRAGLEMPFSNIFSTGLLMPFYPAPKYREGLAMPWRDSYILRAGLLMPWRDARRYRDGLEMAWTGIEPYRAGLHMPFGVVGGAYRAGLTMPFSVLERDVFRAGLNMLWFGGGRGADQQYTVGLTMAGQDKTLDGQPLGAAEIRERRSRSEFVITVTLAMAGDPDMLPGAVLPKVEYAYLDAAGQAAARAAAAVLITVGVGAESETIELLATSVSDEVSVDGTDFTLVCESKGVLLDAPYALPLTREFGPAMAADIAAELVADYPVSLTWSAVNWWIPGGVLYANGETPLEVLRKIKGAVGGKIQSDLVGDLTVTSFYDISRKDWATAAVSESIAYGDKYFRHRRQPLDRDDYNSFLVGDQLSSSNSLRHEEKDVEYGVKEIRGYIVPWSATEIPLQTSGPDRVIIGPGRIVEETIEDELVEIIAGAGRTQYPIYQIIDRDYGDNASLGAISYGEDGAIATEIEGQSLCLVSYRTRYWRWLVRDDVEEQIQLYSMPAWADVPITIIITFGDPQAAQGFVVVEADEVLNVDGDGNTLSELPPGTPFYFLLQHDNTIMLESTSVSSGAVVARGTVARTKEQQIRFVDRAAQELPYIPAGDVAATWYGRSPVLSRDGRKLTPSAWPAIGEIEYPADMRSFVVNPPPLSLGPDDKYYILITLKMVSV